MPALVAQPGVLKAEFLFKVGEDANVMTRLYFTYTGTPPTDATCVTIANALLAGWNNAWLGHLVSSNSILGVKVTDLTTPTSGYGEYLATIPGTASADWNVAAAALLVNYAIARRYRGGKPRSYWPVMTYQDLTDAQTWVAGTLATMTTEWQTDFLDVILGSVTAGCTIVAQCNVSYYEGFTAVQNPITGRWKNVNKPRTVAIAPDVITGFTLNSKPGTQRRRQLHST